jgi:arylsulfatase A-like enzyme
VLIRLAITGIAVFIGVVLALWWKPLHEDARALERSGLALLARAAELAERAETFSQQQALASLPPNPFNGPVYRFDEHLAEAHRLDAVAARAALPDDPGRLDFEFEGADPVALLPPHEDYEIENGVLKLGHRRDTRLMSMRDLQLDRNAVGDIELRIKVEKAKAAFLGWSYEPLSASSEINSQMIGEMRIDTIPDGRFHTYRMDGTVLRRRDGDSRTIRTVVLLPSDTRQERIEIDYLRFIPKRDEYARASAGRTYEILGRELRSALYTNTPLELVYHVNVPAVRPRIRLGAGVLDDDPVRFSVSINEDGAHQEAWALVVPTSDRWHDVEIDLDAWAGDEVEISFRAESAHENVAYWSSPILSGEAPGRFNLLLVLEDTLRADHLSCYGHDRATTPVKDRFAQDGVLFEQAFSQATMTRPSTLSLMTSLYPSATGVWSHMQALDESYLTLAEIMRSQGFVTASFVQNSNAGPAAGLQQGFDRLFDRKYEGSEAMYIDGLNGWLEENAERNFFLYAHVINPHGPYEPPDPFDEWYERHGPGETILEMDSRFDPEDIGTPTAEGRRLLYDGEIRENDHWFERLLERLEESGVRDDTLIVFVSDHGEYLGERDLWAHFPPGYIQVLHVPLIMVHRGAQEKLPAGRRVAEPVQLLDVVPTILELAGIERDALLLQGDSLLTLARGERSAFWSDRAAYSDEATVIHSLDEDEVSASLFRGNRHLLASKRVDAPLLFDIVEDPMESDPLGGFGLTRDLRGSVLPVMAEIRAANQRIWKALVHDSPRVVEYDPDAQEQLRALGYIE